MRRLLDGEDADAEVPKEAMRPEPKEGILEGRGGGRRAARAGSGVEPGAQELVAEDAVDVVDAVVVEVAVAKVPSPSSKPTRSEAALWSNMSMLNKEAARSSGATPTQGGSERRRRSSKTSGCRCRRARRERGPRAVPEI